MIGGLGFLEKFPSMEKCPSTKNNTLCVELSIKARLFTRDHSPRLAFFLLKSTLNMAAIPVFQTAAKNPAGQLILNNWRLGEHNDVQAFLNVPDGTTRFLTILMNMGGPNQTIVNYHLPINMAVITQAVNTVNLGIASGTVHENETARYLCTAIMTVVDRAVQADPTILPVVNSVVAGVAGHPNWNPLQAVDDGLRVANAAPLPAHRQVTE
jgi:hypothetical protein